MRRILLFLSFSFAISISQAQHYHFVYLQADNKQAFYVRVNEKIFSSSATGYVVIPKLQAGKHTLNVGFPKNEWPTQNITINVADNDLGFNLKNFEAKGWGLFNLQTMEVITASNGVQAQSTTTTETKTDQFSNVLADVVNTPSIKEEKKEVAKIPPPVVVPVKEVEVIKENKLPVIETTKEPGKIQKLTSTTGGEGLSITYVDKQASGADTIVIIIPKEANDVTEPVKSILVNETVKIADTLQKPQEQAIKTEDSKSNPKFIEIELPNPNTVSEKVKTDDKLKSESATVLEKETPVEQVAPVKPIMVNSDCKQMATEEDFLKSRKKMTAEDTDDEMVTVAKKLFKQKCYSTEQIKNLSVLFLKDEGKYKLFDAAYPYVYDTQNFKILETQLTDQYYISRFKAMIRN